MHRCRFISLYLFYSSVYLIFDDIILIYMHSLPSVPCLTFGYFCSDNSSNFLTAILFFSVPALNLALLNQSPTKSIKNESLMYSKLFTFFSESLPYSGECLKSLVYIADRSRLIALLNFMLQTESCHFF